MKSAPLSARVCLLLLMLSLSSCQGTGEAAAADIRGAEVTYEVDGVACTGYLAYDAAHNGPRPGVLVVHEWWGHTEYVRRRARMLAAMGYAALAVDMYGGGKTAEHPKDAQKFMMEVMSNMPAGEARFAAAQELLAQHDTTDPQKIAAIGYCFGGAVVLHMARTGVDLRGVASFHGNLATQKPAQKGGVKAAIMICHGGADALVPEEQVKAFRKEMQAAEVDYDFHTYAGAKHGFTNPAATGKGEKFGLPLGYDPAADQKSWAKLTQFLLGVFE